ncbi:hypothetical protein FFWV33_08645 [Flavobacterium faecale]|uniref:MAM domain-containing protein n=1 Tax=Flavobacterium faecale TaxID=1355330 RepID=A0A2S1LCV9_9FLAO|nr:LamG-like jellyroll fold domain-containing protein [Flavobacterium faecale]AWG21595.1 hypothetical protein FFWV33_08645 [Flavobacterium faecale]
MPKTLPTYSTIYLFTIFLISFFAQAQTYTNNVPGTYTIKVPAGVITLQAEAWGGGGAGASRRANDAIRTSGGGGGGYARSAGITVNSSANYTVTVGAGGTSIYNSSTTNVTKVHGTSSSFESLVIAKGGLTPYHYEDLANSTGIYGSGPTGATGSVGAITYNGGNGGYGVYYGVNYGSIYSSSGGGGAGSNGAGNNGSNAPDPTSSLPVGGAGSSAGGGNGGNGRSGAGNGNPGLNYGGGGGGVSDIGYNGGPGAGGKIVLTYNCPNYTLGSTAAAATTPNNSSTITLTSTSSDLPIGTYSITYNLSGSNTATGSTATMVVSTAGAGTFVTSLLANVGNTTITITKLSSGTGDACSTTLSSANTAVISVANAPTIVVKGNNKIINNGVTTPSTLDNTHYGNVQISSVAITKSFTISNNGTASLILTTPPTISGTNASNFTIAVTPATTIAAGASTTFQISFSPTTPGQKNASVTIQSNDVTKSPYTFDLQGQAVQYFYDSDGDGILDDADVDDDNDGILDATEEANCRAMNGYAVNYKFLNETFGAGTNRVQINTTYAATTTYCFQDATTPTICEGSGNSVDLNDGKYTVGPSAQIASWASNIWWLGGDHTGDVNGRMAIFNASYNPGIFYTAEITGALPNIPITYSFWVLNLDRSTASGRIKPNINVTFIDFNDNVLATINSGDIQNDDTWHRFTANLNLPTNAFKVVFTNNNVGGLGNDLALDDIVITQTLCDRDNDGIADVFDLDADNDGIEDVIEVGLGNLTNGTGRIDVPWVDNNNNGLHDSADGTAALPLPTLDSDGDGVPNYLDLDSDNDSLFDVDESYAGNTNAIAGFENGDGDINGDGVGDGPETEAFREQDQNGDGVVSHFGDGILDVYDYGTGTSQYGNRNQGISTGNPATTYLKDTDIDGIPDYLDVMSNNTTWDIANTIKIYDYKTLDTNNDGVIDGNIDLDKDGIIDTFDTNDKIWGSPRDLKTKLFLDFDGRNDYAESTNILDNLPSASLMAWINLKSPFTGASFVVGQNDFQIRITDSQKLLARVNGTTITHTTTKIDESRWYHVAAIFDGPNNIIKLYLNGTMVASEAAPSSTGADSSKLTIGKNSSNDTMYFKGKIDEVRVFNTALTESQLQRMVYQEINNSGGQIRGEIVPKNVATAPSSLPFTNLLRYYRMDNYKDDIIDDLTTPAIDVTGTKIYNHKNIYIQEAPMPFLTERSGDFATAVNSPTKEINGQDIMDQDWSIVKVSHDITETTNNVDLGMFVDAGKTITMNNDTKIENDWYLKLDGKIDLVGKSQLVQTTESDLDVTSAGSIERDQQGQGNLYNYNYWSSPVSRINNTQNNTDHSVSEVMKDGTTTTPQNINWIGGYNGSTGSPISIAKFWINKFDNYGYDYAQWVRIYETGTLRAGQGYTMKGNQGANTTQNYTFVGKPNSGTIDSNVVSNNQILLTGNPYPSALDSKLFIADNTNSFDGNLYFWEHYTTNNTHDLRDYQGGYAALNNVGGIAAVSSNAALISGLGTASKGAPKRYIPVGQAFFIIGKAPSGGTITYKNSQRAFQKEDGGDSNYTFRPSATAKTKGTDDNGNDPLPPGDTYKKVRLGYTSAVNFHRQVLLGFMDDKATSGFDYGYDAYNLDAFPNDMSLYNNGYKLVIQGEGYYNKNNRFPLAVQADQTGKVIFSLDGKENFDNIDNFYIYDKATNYYHNIKASTYEVTIDAGEYLDRFALTFTNSTTENTLDITEATTTLAGITVNHIQNSSTLDITNTTTDAVVKKVQLYDMAGKEIATWKTEKQTQASFQLSFNKLSAGVYVVVVYTTQGKMSKQIIIP